jgi:pimeloyl-ACP methyl ester carboxylesterase
MGTAKTHFPEQVSSLEDKYELILLDLPGHGHSDVDASDQYFEDTLEYVTGKMKEMGEGYIIGLSLGASLAMHIGLRTPELVRGIVLTGYSPFIPEELKDLMKNQYDYFLAIEEKDKETAEHFKMLHGERWKRTLKKVLHTMTFNYPAVTQIDLENLSVPLLILNGSNELHEVEAAAYMKKINNDIKVGLLPNAGHTANIDEPEIYNKVIERFIEQSDECRV